jgi:flavin-dependent dehydrogenase
VERSQSSVVRYPRMDGMPDERYDVVIMGGGLAGLTLALQLKQSRPETSIMVAEKRAGPAPAAAFKVGESTVELSAYYFGIVVGMRDHMADVHHPKSGLRYFLPADGNEDITARLEWGPAEWPKADAFQLDRGVFENELMRRAILAQIHAYDGCRVEEVEIGEGDDEHRVTVSREDELGGEARATVSCRWLVDATGRKFMLKKQLGLLKDCPHTANSAWLRLGGGLDVEEFSDDPAWRERMRGDKVRMSSTNHLLGEGYWVWLIPLGTGPISIGIVADPRFHPFERMNTLDAALDWFREHEPQLFEVLDRRRDDVEDFLKVEDFAYSCERLYSPDRWCLTGEAGVFLDPFYSPGSDFIAMSNTFIDDLIVRDLGGEDVNQRPELFNGQLLQLFEAWLRLYLDTYGVFGNPRVMNAKLVWEFSLYWGVSAPRFMNGRLTDLPFTQEVAPVLQTAIGITARMEPLFRRWHELSPPEPVDGFIDTTTLPCVIDMQEALEDRVTDADELKARFFAAKELLEALAVLIFHTAARSLPEEQRPPDDARTNPYAVSLDPGRWEEDGLFDGSGLTPAEARERAPGVEEVLRMEAGVFT